MSQCPPSIPVHGAWVAGCFEVGWGIGIYNQAAGQNPRLNKLIKWCLISWFACYRPTSYELE